MLFSVEERQRGHHGVECIAMVGNHEHQGNYVPRIHVQRRREFDRGCAGAIGINLVVTRFSGREARLGIEILGVRRRRLVRRRLTVAYDKVDLSEVAVAVEVGHGNAVPVGHDGCCWGRWIRTEVRDEDLTRNAEHIVTM